MASTLPWVVVDNLKQLSCVQMPSPDQKYTFHWHDAVALCTMNCGDMSSEGDRGNRDRRTMYNEIEMHVKAEREMGIIQRQIVARNRGNL